MTMSSFLLRWTSERPYIVVVYRVLLATQEHLAKSEANPLTSLLSGQHQHTHKSK